MLNFVIFVGLCGMTKHYEITTGKDRHLFSASPENSSICGCFSQDFDNVVITDLQNVPILEIQKIEFSGYLSTKLVILYANKWIYLRSIYDLFTVSLAKIMFRQRGKIKIMKVPNGAINVTSG